ncbi:hypothetical protein B0H11DRAFT_1814757 [Mycena galericulata]|nr:hypothetical protein B0H11DRAFT_1814757 [Mycena galericulata]
MAQQMHSSSNPGPPTPDPPDYPESVARTSLQYILSNLPTQSSPTRERSVPRENGTPAASAARTSLQYILSSPPTQSSPTRGESIPRENGTSGVSVVRTTLGHILSILPTQSSPTRARSIPRENDELAKALAKRQRNKTNGREPHTEICRIVDNHVSQDRDRVVPLTTIVCLHPAVGRRSYRTKKRFLWPPPMVYVHSTGGKMLGQEVTMTVIPDVGESSSAQRATLDEEMKCSFGSLYLKAPGAKTMHLSLEITNRFPPTTGDIVPRDACSWVTLNSGPIPLLCPFTKQPPRTVNPPDCLVEGRPLALFSRLDKNSPVKYMVVERTELRASEMAWSAFNVRVVAGPPPIPNIDGPQPVMFGSSIILSDAHSGFSTPPLKIRRVENGQVSDADGRPVTHMQKIVLEGLWPDGSRGYVAAVDSGRGKSQKRGRRFSHRLFYQSPSFEQTMEDGVSFITEYVDQSVCWMIVGLAQFEYTFFDAWGQNDTVPDIPIAPITELLTRPVYDQANNTLELKVAGLLYFEPLTGAQRPLDVFLGNLGPLRYADLQTFANPSRDNDAGIPGFPLHSASTPPLLARNSYALAVIEMPALAELMKALEQDVFPVVSDDLSSDRRRSPPADNTWSNGDTRTSMVGRSLPLLFIRPLDGVVYHSGRSIACEKISNNTPLVSGNMTGNPLNPGRKVYTGAAASGFGGWTVRVM